MKEQTAKQAVHDDMDGMTLKVVDPAIACTVCGRLCKEVVEYDMDGNEPSEPVCQTCVEAWDEIDSDTQDHLKAWYNCSPMDGFDYAVLAKLLKDRNFIAYDCGNCGEPVRQGQPDSWERFQGVLQEEGRGQLCGCCYRKYEWLKELAGE